MFTRRPQHPGLPPPETPIPETPHAQAAIRDLPLPELKAFHEKVGAILAQRTAEAREDFRQDFLAKLALFGMSLDDFKPAPQKKERKTREVKPKYRHPETGEEWSGRGKPPAWMQELLHQGRAAEEFLIGTHNGAATL